MNDVILMNKSKDKDLNSDEYNYMVTSALPYANGPIHIGHLAGAYLPADEYVRYLRARGEDVLYVCGTDEHGTPIEMKAHEEGKKPQEVVDKFHDQIKETFDKVNISFDIFSRTTEDIHYKTSQDFFSRLKEKDFMDKRKSIQLYCDNDEMFLPDRYVNGTCPYCGAEDQRGDQCEECGHVLDPDELKDPYCALCGETPVEKETEHYYFELSRFQERLENWIDENDHWRKTTKNMVKGWLEEGLEDRSITRDLSWGIPLPEGEDQDKTLYVWFEAPIGYLSFTKQLTEDWKDYWLEEGKETRLVHFIGKDNVPFHAIIWPAMLMGYGDYDGSEFVLPWMVPSNEHLNLEGRQFSTSRDWAIWIEDFIENYPTDYLRYYITAIAPEKRDTDFRWKDFQTKVNNELADIYGNFIHRALTFTQNYFDGEVPEADNLNEVDKEFLETIEETKDKIESDMEKFKFKKSLKGIITLAKEGNAYFDKKKPWKTIEDDEEKTATTINLSLRLVKSLAVLSHPFIPDSSERVWNFLNMGKEIEGSWSEIGSKMKVGREIEEPEVLFEKVEDEQIEKEIKSLKSKSKEEEGKKEKEDEKMTVSFDEFQKLDIKIGKVLSVSEIEEADDLYKLVVDMGIEKRVLVAGLRNHYDKDELKGKQISVLTNLESKEMFGIKSQGMLLAAEEEQSGVVSLLTPDKEVKEGSEVH